MIVVAEHPIKGLLLHLSIAKRFMNGQSIDIDITTPVGLALQGLKRCHILDSITASEGKVMPVQNSLPRDFVYYEPIRMAPRNGWRSMLSGNVDLTRTMQTIIAKPSSLLNPADLIFEIFRDKFFKTTNFCDPHNDPGWFGPDSAMWYVLADPVAFYIGLNSVLFIELFHPQIQYAAFDHTKMMCRDSNGRPTGQFDVDMLIRRIGESLAAFYGAAMGTTATAESMSQIMTSMHSKMKGRGPGGLHYDATDADLYRWTFATVVYPIAAAHERYHKAPLKGPDLDRFFEEFTLIGEKFGNGIDLPRTKADCERVLRAKASEVCININNAAVVEAFSPSGKFLLKPVISYMFWFSLHLQPPWFQSLLQFRNKPIYRMYYWVTKTAAIAINRLGTIREVDQAFHRVRAEGDCAESATT